ncbi:MAG: macro domain-containing protein [candidate division WOR-3 bacterium]
MSPYRSWINKSSLEIVLGDITQQTTEAIVNSANRNLEPGGGVSGAIHRAAGPELAEECRKLGGCNTTEAKLTKGYNLKAKYVIHTVGPIFRYREKDAIDLRNTYLNCLKLALENGIKSIAFPSISTGIYGYPIREAAEIALTAIKDFLRKNHGINLVRIVLLKDDDFRIYKQTAERLRI